jgi:hypothetical protein
MRLSAMVKVILRINPAGEEGTAARDDLAAQPEMTMMSSRRMSAGSSASPCAQRGELAFIGHERREAAKRL